MNEIQEENIPQNQNWMEEEADKLKQPLNYEEKPSLKLQPDQVTEITVDFSKPFEEWTGEQGGKTVTKKIIPVTVNGNAMNWWLNVKNPVYRDILNAGKDGQTTIKILQTGKQANTKYVLVK